jgi:hypothetical protein
VFERVKSEGRDISSLPVTVHSEEYSLLEESRLSLGQDRIAYHFEIDNEEVSAFYNALK